MVAVIFVSSPVNSSPTVKSVMSDNAVLATSSIVGKDAVGNVIRVAYIVLFGRSCSVITALAPELTVFDASIISPTLKFFSKSE